MRLLNAAVCAIAVAVLVPTVSAQMDPDRVVPGGGVAPGWKGAIDTSSKGQGRTINDSKFEIKNGTITIAAGPAAVYWNPANTASGDYTIKGTFTEPVMESASSHSHPYGIFIGGHDLGTDQMSLVYCSAYGTGNFIVRGFSPKAPRGVFQMNGRGTADEAVHHAEKGAAVTQEIAWTVKGSRAECSINGKVVAGYDKSGLVGPDKLQSLDGIYGIRVSHNLDVSVTGFGKQ